MPESSFYDVNLHKSVFNNVNLENNSFSNINLSHSAFYDANLTNTVFTSVNLSGAKFSHIGTSVGSDYQGKIINPIQFEDADLTQSSFTTVDFTNAEFKNCIIKGLVINGIDIEALINGDVVTPALFKTGWRTQNDTGSTNKVSKNHYMAEGADKTLCGVEIPSIDKVAEMSPDIGTGLCKRCTNIKKTY
jgi:uncharacterized protein YjbI with pentapeptide repeats